MDLIEEIIDDDEVRDVVVSGTGRIEMMPGNLVRITRYVQYEVGTDKYEYKVVSRQVWPLDLFIADIDALRSFGNTIQAQIAKRASGRQNAH